MTDEQTRSIDLSADVATLDGDCLVDDLADLGDIMRADPSLVDMALPGYRARAVRLGGLLSEGRAEVDLAATLATGQRAGQQAGARAGYQQGYQAGLAAGRAERKPSAASVVIERDQQGRATAVTEQDPEGRITRRRIEHDADGRLLRVVSASG